MPVIYMHCNGIFNLTVQSSVPSIMPRTLTTHQSRNRASDQELREARTELTELIQHLLRLVISDPNAKMQWSARRYWAEIVSKRRVAVIGWPVDIKFANPFRLTGLNTIGRLSFLWRRGQIYFHCLDEAEFYEWKAALEPVAEAARLVSLLSRAPRSDLGDTRALRLIETRSKNRRALSTGLKSARYIEDEDNS
ncbi:hypothetical protein BC629DRAFT_1534627 [Irpex lacteus]|nr:hypothetical protein BC629DRAFT_1534627 [Irpex lacteus]